MGTALKIMRSSTVESASEEVSRELAAFKILRKRIEAQESEQERSRQAATEPKKASGKK